LSLETFNSLPEAAARERLLACCAAPRWAGAVAAGRPYASTDALHAAAESALTDADVADGLAGHPRIGERTADPRSSAEQSRVAGAPLEVLDGLAAGNVEYERRFGHVYLVCASGRSAEELLAVLGTRLTHDPATERAVVHAELAAINRLRLDRLLADLVSAQRRPDNAPHSRVPE
jgi:2-oxo-4-hydroxy-4-carboxy-5-ureidoimidazoline decarboxylase